MITKDTARLFQLPNGKIDTKWKSKAKDLGMCLDNITTQDVWDLCQQDIKCPVCKICDRKVKLTNIGRTETCGNKECALTHKREKTRNTAMDRYGVAHTSKLEHVKNKQLETFGKKYGGHPSKLPETQDKRARTNLKKYGTKTPAVAADRIEQSVEKYKQTRKKNYVETVWPRRRAAILESLGIEALSDWISADAKIKWKHLSCGHEWANSIPDGSFPWCPRCGLSKEQSGIEHYITSIYAGEIKRNDRRTIAPLELDVHLPTLGLAFEINGWYWHQDGKSTPLRKKYEMCYEKRIRLINIMDWEWNNKRHLVQSYISHALGINNQKIDARKVIVKNISSSTAAEFFERCHINGHVKASHYYGIQDNSGTVVAAMSLSKPRWSGEDLEIIRWAVAPHLNIRGGFSKVLSHVIKDLNPATIISYCDLRWGTGKVYAATGFKNLGDTKPNYWWIKGNQRLSRYETQKHNLVNILGQDFNPELSEADNMISCGWCKISDCGNSKWVWTAAD
jgi:hypothetical protein